MMATALKEYVVKVITREGSILTEGAYYFLAKSKRKAKKQAKKVIDRKRFKITEVMERR